ncbi:MAG: o-succinylbenzoate synthase [Phycisphaerales bacterium]
MSDPRVEIARYSLALARPFRFAGTTLTRRDGFFVRIDGRGVGEVAPMPGVHREGVDECLAILRERGPLDLDGMPSALAFGVSCALECDEPILRSPLRPSIGVNALFVGDAAAARAAIDARRFEGANTIKVKVARREDRATVETLLDGLGPAVRLRLDANRGLAFDDAVALVAGLPPDRIEYLEEPLDDPLRLPELHHATGHSIALDESLLEPNSRAALETAPGVTTHVLKPSLHGSLARVRARAERTARQLLGTTVSSALETNFTLRLLARLVTWLPSAEGDHGLGTSGMLVGDPTTAPTITGGRMSTGEPVASPNVAFTPIEECDVR